MKNRAWLYEYLKRSLLPGEKADFSRRPVHVLFLCTDHFEPGTGGVTKEKADWRIEKWEREYTAMSSRHRDFEGRPPRHGWFYPPHYYDCNYFNRLNRLCFNGRGEIELHLHHDHDTPGSLTRLLEKTLSDYNKLGMLITLGEKPEVRYAFIHGMWSLDNALGPEYCGVNEELIILSRTGCFADFTFPSGGFAQPVQVNSIYYARDDPEAPKSYDRGKPVRAHGQPWGDLLMFQGPLCVDFSPLFRLKKPIIDMAGVNRKEPGTPERVDAWIRTGVHVHGRPDWIFVKIATHSAQEENHDTIIGDRADRMYSYLEEKYNDGENFCLHYVTAREAYNIVKAAEAGMSGNPYDYRDYLIPPYANTAVHTESLYRLGRYTPDACELDVLDGEGDVTFLFNSIPVTRLQARDLKRFTFHHEEEAHRFLFRLQGTAGAALTVKTPAGVDPGACEFMNATLEEKSGDSVTVSIHADGPGRVCEASITYKKCGLAYSVL